MRRLNIKLLIFLAVSTVIVCAGVYFVHGWQVEDNIDSLFQEAKQLDEDKNYDKAIQLYRRYLANAPADAPFEDEARTNLAIAADEISIKEMGKGADGNIGAIRRAYALLKDANIAVPDNADVKRRLINYYLIDRGSPNALKLADELIQELIGIEENKDDVDLHMQLAASQQGRGQDQAAIDTLSKVVGYDEKSDEFQTTGALDATMLEAYLQLAQLLSKKQDKAESAKKVVDKLVSLNPGEYKAYEYRSRFWRWRLSEDTAEASHDTIRAWIKSDLAKARELAPDNGQILIASADFETEQENYQQAEVFLREAVDKYENKFTVYAKLAESLLRQGKRDEALAEIRRGSEVMPEHAVLLRVQADLQLDGNSVEEAEKTLKQLSAVIDERQLGRRNDDAMQRYYLQYLKARVSFAKRDWVAARRQFDRIRPLISTRKDVLRRVDHYLSVCHQQLGEGEKVAEGSRQGMLREIQLMVSGGDLDGAIDRMQLMSELNGMQRFLADPQYRALWRTLLVQKAVATPESDPGRWNDVDQLLEYLEKQENYKGVEKIVAEANIRYLQGKKTAAGRLLRDAIRGEHKEDLRVWVAWINMYQKERPGKETLAQIDLAEQALGDTVPIRLLRIAHVAGQAADDPGAVVDILQKLSRNTDQYSKADRVRLLKGTAAAYLRIGDSNKAQSIYQEIATLDENDPSLRTQMFNLALATGDDSAMDDAIETIGKMLGTQSAQYKQMQASKIISRVNRKQDDIERLKEASSLLDEAKQKRPQWHEIARLKGEIAWTERKLNDALTHYETAVAQGSRHVMVLRRLARLLHAAGRHDEALERLSLLGEGQKAGLTRLEAQSYSMTGDPKRALAMAEEAIKKDENDWSSHLWYGQLLQRAERSEEAEKHFRRAVELKPDQPGNWVSLVAHLVKTEKAKEAEDVTRQVEATLPESVAPAVLAQCYELLGKRDRAEKHYRKLHQINPDDTATNRIIAQFYLRSGNLPSAQQYLANIMQQSAKKDDPNVFWARRALAELKSKNGTYRDTILALKLLDANQLDGKQQPTDKRLRAQLLATRPERTSRLKAIRLFEELRDEKQLSNDQTFLLAKLYLATNNFKQFQQVMQSLPLKDNQTYLTTYIDALVTENQLKQAAPLLRRLEAIDSELPSAVALRARMLNEIGKTNEAVALLKRLVPETLAVNKLGLLPQVAKLMEDFGHPDEADVLYRRFEREHPAGVLARAGFLGRQGDLDQAFRLLSGAKNKLALPAVIQTGLGVMLAQQQKDHQIKFEPNYFQALESWFAQAEGKQPGSLRTAVLLPQLRTLQGRLNETMDLYNKLLKRDDLTPLQRAMFLNNLAFMNAIRNQKMAASRKMIDEAIDIMGPNSDLLDTRAVTLIGYNNTKAIADLETAIAESPDAIKFFHLALVHLDAKDLNAARTSFAQANEKGFDIDALDPAERGQYDRLVDALKRKPKDKRGLTRAA